MCAKTWTDRPALFKAVVRSHIFNVLGRETTLHLDSTAGLEGLPRGRGGEPVCRAGLRAAACDAFGRGHLAPRRRYCLQDL